MPVVTPREELFDRDAEVALLRDALADARAGRGPLVIVEGEPGIGKTALLATVHREATAGGCPVLAATGGELERGFAWGVVRQIFEPLVYGANCSRRRSPCAAPRRWRARPSGCPRMTTARRAVETGPLPRSTAFTG